MQPTHYNKAKERQIRKLQRNNFKVPAMMLMLEKLVRNKRTLVKLLAVHVHILHRKDIVKQVLHGGAISPCFLKKFQFSPRKGGIERLLVARMMMDASHGYFLLVEDVPAHFYLAIQDKGWVSSKRDCKTFYRGGLLGGSLDARFFGRQNAGNVILQGGLHVHHRIVYTKFFDHVRHAIGLRKCH